MLQQKARADFEKATWKAFLNQIYSWLTRKPNELLPFEEVQGILPTTGQRYRGLQEIPVSKIAGSVGRYRDFDRAFLPTQRHTRERWMNIDAAHHGQQKLPPIDVYKIGDVYFVKDGNHRVSVAKEREQIDIDAYVTEIDTPIEVTPDTDLDMLIRQIEKRDFFQQTHLDILRIGNQIRLTLPGGYEKLLEHIRVHRWFMGIDNKREFSWDEAVQSWYDLVYMPVVDYIRDHHVLDDFPNRTETDLYLWILEHRTHLRADPFEAPIEEAAEDFVEKNSTKPVKRAVRVVRNTIKSLTEMIQEGDQTETFSALPPERD